MTVFPCGFLPGLAVGLGIGALAEVAKKSIRHNGAAGNLKCFLFAGLKVNDYGKSEVKVKFEMPALTHSQHSGLWSNQKACLVLSDVEP